MKVVNSKKVKYDAIIKEMAKIIREEMKKFIFQRANEVSKRKD